MNTILPVEAKTSIAFPTVNFSSVVPKTAMVTIVLIIPTSIDAAHTIVRLAFMLPSPDVTKSPIPVGVLK
jgi:hypothetical protein